jgi:hypothetical protein
LARWVTSYGEIKGLIQEPTLTQAPATSEGREPKDLFDYGVEHILFVDEALLVDFLVLNGWAATHHCLVVSEQNYPTHIAALAQRFLTEQPTVPVWLLHAPAQETVQHSADNPGQDSMRTRLLRRGWELDAHPIRDLGLSLEAITRTRLYRNHYPGLDARELRPVVLPPTLLLNALSERFAAGDASESLLPPTGSLAGSSTFGLDADSDFG